MVIGWSGGPARIDVCCDGCIDVLLSDHPTAVSRCAINKLWFEFGTAREALPSFATGGKWLKAYPEPRAGRGPGEREFLVQMRERGRGKQNSRSHREACREVEACTRIGTAPDENGHWRTRE